MMGQTMNKEASGVKGLHIFSICDARTETAQRLSDLIENVRMKRMALTHEFKGNLPAMLMKELWDEYNYYIQQLHKRYLVNQIAVENITTTVGRAALADRIAGVNTYSGNINYTGLGTDTTVETISDTTLGNETYRKAFTAGTSASNVAYVETFFTQTEVSGTFEEYAHFIDGTAATDSGQMFNRFTESVTKTTSETLNIQSTITFNNG